MLAAGSAGSGPSLLWALPDAALHADAKLGATGTPPTGESAVGPCALLP